MSVDAKAMHDEVRERGPGTSLEDYMRRLTLNGSHKIGYTLKVDGYEPTFNKA